jgi:hypothetical protein
MQIGGQDTTFGGMRNRIINGAMVIDQRNAGASVTNSNNGSSFITDRFRGDAPVDQSMTFQQQTSVVPSGFTYALKVTAGTATSNTNNQPALAHFVEGFNTADLGFGTVNAKTITLSFQVYSSLTGTFGVCFENNDGTRAYIASYTINTANTWETKTITIAGDTSGTWEKTNQRGLSIFFDLGYGTNISAAASSAWANLSSDRGLTGGVKLAANTGATWYITGVQLEKGSAATAFENRQFGTELALCQRYYWQQTSNTSTSLDAIATGSSTNSTTGAQFIVRSPVTMRSSPTFVARSQSGFLVFDTNAFVAVSSISIYGTISSPSATLLVTVNSAVSAAHRPTTLHFTNASGSIEWLSLSSEL